MVTVRDLIERLSALPPEEQERLVLLEGGDCHGLASGELTTAPWWHPEREVAEDTMITCTLIKRRDDE